MIVTKHYAVTYDAERDAYAILSSEVPRCPVCGAIMCGHGIRRRHAIDSAGVSHWYLLRRWRCPACQSFHLELPDFMAPRRHYEAETIRDVQIGDGESCPADDSTIRRWKKAEALPALPVTEDTTGVKFPRDRIGEGLHPAQSRGPSTRFREGALSRLELIPPAAGQVFSFWGAAITLGGFQSTP